MSRNNPSGRRRAGREAFHPDLDPRDAFPYNNNPWYYQSYFDDFLEGWHQSEKEWNESQQVEEDKDLADMVLDWWDEHRYDTVMTGDGDYDNAFDEEPDFVREAKKLKGR